MERVLFAWIGNADIEAAFANGENDLGPIGQAAVATGYDRLVLLDNYGKKENVSGYIEWLCKLCPSKIIHREVALESPVDFTSIYLVALEEVRKVINSSKKSIIPVFHLSPGTPAMASVWVLLGKAVFSHAELIRSSQENGVETVQIPFDISAEFTPIMAKAADERLTKMAEGLPPEAPEFRHIIHKCAEMKRLVTQARIVALRDVPVLIEGETGSGKELFARAIHAASSRSQEKFVSVNCGAIPEGLFETEFFGHKKGSFTGADRDRTGYFELANRGTLFLDELGEMPTDVQVKLLRVLNNGMVRRIGDDVERQVDIRVIAATNRDLLKEASTGHFRSDLFYRLAVAMLKLPPLREREGDIGLMIDSMLHQVNTDLSVGPNYKHKKFSVNAKNIMLQHLWPGNARELFNTIMRICVWCPENIIHEDDVRQALLPDHGHTFDDILHKPMDDDFNLQEILDFVSSSYIKRAIEKSAGNKSRAAKLLGLSNYQTLSNWMHRLGIDS